MADRAPRAVGILVLHLAASLVIFALLAATTEFFAGEIERRAAGEQREEIVAHAGAIRAVLESELNATVYLASGIEAYIVTRDGKIGPDEIRGMLGVIHQRGRHFRNIAIAPGNRIQYVYPLAGNEKAVGLHYQDIPQQWPAIERLIASKKGLLAGPVKLVQGGEGLVYRVPVFIGEHYWGLISTVIDSADLFRTIDPMAAQHGIRIALRGRDGTGEDGDVFYGDESIFAAPPALMTVSVPGGTWQMAAVARTAPATGQTLLARAIGWTSAGAIAALAYLLFGSLHRRQRLMGQQQATLDALRTTQAALTRHRQELESTVATRTAELRLANESLNQAKAAAEASTQAKSAFIANMSHEIRTPMHAIMGMTHILRRKDPRPDQQERLERISAAADHLLEILDDILDISKIEAGKMEITPHPFAVSELAERLQALFADPASHKSLAFSLDFSALPARLIGDDTRLGQILINFVGNAFKFTDQGSVRVWADVVHRDQDGLIARFSVADTGIGLSIEQTRRVFDAFEQGDNSTTRKYGGTGLGLAINRRLASLMGGATGVDSSLGHGSTFWFTARLSVADPSEAATAS